MFVGVNKKFLPLKVLSRAVAPSLRSMYLTSEMPRITSRSPICMDRLRPKISSTQFGCRQYILFWITRNPQVQVRKYSVRFFGRLCTFLFYAVLSATRVLLLPRKKYVQLSIVHPRAQIKSISFYAKSDTLSIRGGEGRKYLAKT